MRQVAEQYTYVAKRACQMAGIDHGLAEGFAKCAVAEFYLNNAERTRLAAQMADHMEYRRRDEHLAEQMKQLSLELQQQAAALGVTPPSNTQENQS